MQSTAERLYDKAREPGDRFWSELSDSEQRRFQVAARAVDELENQLSRERKAWTNCENLLYEKTGELRRLSVAFDKLKADADAAASRLVVELYRERDWDGTPVGDAVDALGEILRPAKATP
jgi:hypothetical protein